MSAYTDHAKEYRKGIGEKSGLIVKDTKPNGEYEIDIPFFLGWKSVLQKVICFE
jgi:hypothetical protein